MNETPDQAGIGAGPDARPAFEEHVAIPGWATLVLGVTIAISLVALFDIRRAVAYHTPGQLLVWDLIWGFSLFACVASLLLLGRLVIRIDSRALVVRFGFVPWLETRIPLSEIASAKPIDYSPIGEFGGWGIRTGIYAGVRTAVYSLRGSKGVLLDLLRPIDTPFTKTTSRILIGCDHVGELAERIGATPER